MVIVAVEALPVGSKPPAAVSVRISTGEKHVFGAPAPLSTRVSSLEQGRVVGPMKSSPKLVICIWSGLTWFAKELFKLIVRSAATSSIRLRVLVSDGTSAFMARRGCRDSCSRPAKRWLFALIFSVISSNFLSIFSKSPSIIRYRSANVGWSGPTSSWRTGPLPPGMALLQFRGS